MDEMVTPLLTAGMVEIARQLSLLHKKKISAVQPDELLDKRWERPAWKDRTPNVLKLKDMFNSFVDMVQYEIINCPDKNTAVKLIKRLLEVADFCKN
jgi:hypothetical protein